MGTQQKAGRPDYLLLAALAALCVIGLLMVYSSSVNIALNMSTPQPVGYFLIRQIIWLVVGVVATFLAIRVDYHSIARWSALLLAGNLALLLVVKLIGADVNGATRWLVGQSIQPSEIAKLTVILYIAYWLASKGKKLQDFRTGLLPFVVLVAAVTGLIVLQPDFSTALLIGAVCVCMFFVSGTQLRQVASLLGGTFGAAALIGVMGNYRQERLSNFWAQWRDPLAGEYYTRLIRRLVSAGGAFGHGLGSGQQVIDYLPGSHTDFIYAFVVYELGVVGALVILGLFLLIAWRGIRAARMSKDNLGLFLAVGLTSVVFLQALLNMGTVIGMLPTTGKTLPFISYGGSSLVVSMMAVGLLVNVSRNAGKQESESSEVFALGWGDRRPRVSRARRRPRTVGTGAR
jgi:cell division protein FtsW